jgi:hypothetical protein
MQISILAGLPLGFRMSSWPAMQPATREEETMIQHSRMQALPSELLAIVVSKG